ncbi:hypothetical protein [Candidatus Poriferisodalis sp.]|uniref:hypothetical protein n=1 Tax=Candidatus Poriferisodalis sp. TaxID=3101277 RepID=UPI003B01344D
MSAPTMEHDEAAAEQSVMTRYAGLLAGIFCDGSWDEVAAHVESAASTSSQGVFTRWMESSPHPTPEMASRVRQLKEDSALTWDQLRRLFGVSRRAIHMWAAGAQMNSFNEERLTELAQIVSELGSTPQERRDALMRPAPDGGRSRFQELALARSVKRDFDIEALTESASGGRTAHGEFVFAEVIDDEEER